MYNKPMLQGSFSTHAEQSSCLDKTGIDEEEEGWSLCAFC